MAKQVRFFFSMFQKMASKINLCRVSIEQKHKSGTPCLARKGRNIFLRIRIWGIRGLSGTRLRFSDSADIATDSTLDSCIRCWEEGGPAGLCWSAVPSSIDLEPSMTA